MNIRIKGGQVLSGEVTPSGSKNSAVHLIPATLLFDKPVTLENVPDVTDVERLVEILKVLGSKISWDKEKSVLEIDNSGIKSKKIKTEILGNMRGTAILWGGLLARFGEVEFEELPGGCTLGNRPFEPIYNALKEMGVQIEFPDCGVKMKVKSLKGGEFWLTEMSPTVTTNMILLASKIEGTTKLIGAASEPQIQDLCYFLQKAGLTISGIGSSVLVIQGGKNLGKVSHRLFSDHYEVTTFLALGAATGGKIKVKNTNPELFKSISHEFSKFNVNLKIEGDSLEVDSNADIRLNNTFADGTMTVRAQPWPHLPVDLLPVYVPLALSVPNGRVLFHNWMYESGLYWTQELNKLGAEVIICDPHRVLVTGGRKLVGAKLEAPYIIRAVVSMVIAGMIAEGETTILNADSLYRGHPHFSENLQKLGAEIEEIK